MLAICASLSFLYASEGRGADVWCSGVGHIEQLKEYSSTIPAVNQIEVCICPINPMLVQFSHP